LAEEDNKNNDSSMTNRWNKEERKLSEKKITIESRKVEVN
jgi:hypothetical protein